ncbi:hypothetical protein Dimus_014151 [Dionaea muscipula]
MQSRKQKRNKQRIPSPPLNCENQNRKSQNNQHRVGSNAPEPSKSEQASQETENCIQSSKAMACLMQSLQHQFLVHQIAKVTEQDKPMPLYALHLLQTNEESEQKPLMWNNPVSKDLLRSNPFPRNRSQTNKIVEVISEIHPNQQSTGTNIHLPELQ